MNGPFAGVDAVTEGATVDVRRGLRDEGRGVVVHPDPDAVRPYFEWVVLY